MIARAKQALIGAKTDGSPTAIMKYIIALLAMLPACYAKSLVSKLRKSMI
jgi:hypothetical protein|tara:strand:+ start:1717 stop:1866 length:150 start_codon:yes stop_codon:yes gene_type:complete